MIQIPPSTQTSEALQRVIEGLLIVGIVIQLIKGADILLRPHQQKWLQDKFDTLALWLDFRRPLRWYMEAKNIRRVQAGMAGLGATVASIALFIDGQLPRIFAFFLAIGGIILVVLALIDHDIFKIRADRFTYPGAYSGDAKRMRVADRLSEWIVNSSLAGHLAKQLLFIGIGAAFLLLVWRCVPPVVAIFQYIGSLKGRWGFLIILALVIILGTIVNRFGPYVEALLTVCVMSTLSLAFCLLVILAEIVLKILRGLVWRITEYNKGAYAALLLLITSLLAVIEVYLRFLKK